MTLFTQLTQNNKFYVAFKKAENDKEKYTEYIFPYLTLNFTSKVFFYYEDSILNFS
jgi:hypothetical protein